MQNQILTFMQNLKKKTQQTSKYNKQDSGLQTQRSKSPELH